MTTRLSVNVNKIATLRNQRQGNVPNVLQLSQLALEAGACGITVHPRPDERHIRTRDCVELSACLREQWTNKEFNIEGNPFHGVWFDLVKDLKPHQATLVPDSPGQITSDHGIPLDLDTQQGKDNLERFLPVVEALKAEGIRVSAFLDPNPKHVEGAVALGVDRIELYTEGWCQAHASDEEDQALRAYANTAKAAVEAGLGVNAGHDLNLSNLSRFLEGVQGVLEVSIGQALVADALTYGMAETVRRYCAICGDD